MSEGRIEQQDKKGKEITSINGASTSKLDSPKEITSINGASTSKLDSPPLPSNELTNSIRDKLKCHCLPDKPSIFKVHEKFQKVNRHAYTPELVSIGPFHRENRTLWCMEEHKLSYAHTFISRSGLDLKNYVESIWSIKDVARDCYAVRFNGLNDDQFVEMMLVDGLFIILLFQKFAYEADKKGDPIFANSWMVSSLVRDLVLLENQIPMCVLSTLFKKSIQNDSNPRKSESTLQGLALKFFSNLLSPIDLTPIDLNKVDGGITHFKHLLDLLGKSVFYGQSQALSLNIGKIKRPCEEKNEIFLHCATELNRAGIKFKKGPSKGSFFDISFRNGVLKIPAISIQDQTEVLFRNLIAYEQSSAGNTSHMISYASFMDNLIDSPEDVKFLCDAGIITNILGDHHDVSNLFNKLLCEVAMGDNLYSSLYGEVNEYYKAPQHAWRATFKREYFKNPWTVCSLLAAIALLGLTITQTVFTIKEFNKPSK